MAAEPSFRTWTPQVYEALHQTLSNLSEGIDASLNQLAELLEIFFPVFDTVLQNPAPEEADRTKLLAPTLTIGELEYKTNKEFQQCAERVSKAVNLNELYAAHLVIVALPQAQKFDRSQTETAIYLHYSRRQYLLGSLLQVVRLAADSSIEDNVRRFLLDYVSRLCKEGTGLDGKSFPVRLVEAMNVGRDDVVRLDEQQRNRLILRDTVEAQSDEDLRLRRKLVAQEIDTIGLILHGLVRLKFVNDRDVQEVLTRLQSAEKLDVLAANLIVPLLSWLSQLCAMDENVTADTPTPTLPPFNGLTLKTIHRLIIENTWKLPLLGAYIQVYWLSALNGICKLEDNAAAEFTYKTDILEPAEAAAKAGGFDFAIKYVLQPARSGVFTPALRPEITKFLTIRKLPSLSNGQFEPIFMSPDSRDLSIYQLEHFVQLVISHLADVLKQIRLVEEDKALAEGSLFDYSEQSVQHASSEERDFSLEVFFLLISQLYSDRPDSGERFLSDPDSALYGFLNWASGVKPVSMLWTFMDLMASLAEGPNCSVAVDKLFSQDTSEQPKSKRFHQSWKAIFGAIQYYAENLSPPTVGNASIGRTPIVYDRLEIDDESTVVLKSYLRVIRNVAANSHDAKISLLSKNEDRVLSHLFELSVNRLATDLRAELWLTLAAFSKDDKSIIAEIWEKLDLRLQQYFERVQSQRTFFNAPVITRTSTFKDVNLVTLDITAPDTTSPEEYAAFLYLLSTLIEVSSVDHPLHDILTFDEHLGEKYRLPGVHPFVNFVMQLFHSASTSSSLDAESKSVLVSRCLDFLYQCLDSFNPDLIKFANVTGINIDQAIGCSSLKAYISLHPGALVMTHILDDRILGPILEKLNVPIEQLNEETTTSPVAKSVLRGLQVIDTVLNCQRMFMDVVEPQIRDTLQTLTSIDLHSLRHTSLKSIESRILSRVSSVVQIALFVNAEDPEIALLAIRILDRLAAFARGSTGGPSGIEFTRRNRLLEIIRNNKDSKRIMFGVLNKLEDTDTEEAIVPFESNSLRQKRAVLSLLRKDLIESPETPSIAHFLLGYHITEGGRLELGNGKGNIGSEVSVLKSVFSLIDPLEDDVLSATVSERNSVETMSRDLSTSEMALEIVVRLCKATLSADVTTTTLRQDATYLQLFSNEIALFPKLLSAIELALREGLPVIGRSSIVSSSIRRKTWLLRYLANELHIFTSSKAFSSLRSMTEYLIGKKSESKGFRSLFDPESNEGRRLLTFFEQVIINVGSFDDIDPSVFGNVFSQVDWSSCRSEPRPGYFESDCQQVSELILLKTNEMLTTPPPKDEKLLHYWFEQGRNVVETFVDRNVKQEMTWANGECLEAWSELFTVILEEGLKTVSHPVRESFINESVRIIALRFGDISFLHSPHADSLSYILFHLVEAMQDPPAIGTRGGILDLLDPSSDRFATFFGNILAAIQGCSHIQSIRENLYFVIYSCITFAISYTQPSEAEPKNRSTLRSKSKKLDSHSFLSSLVNLSTTNGERFVDMLCHDSLTADGTCKVTSTLLLGVLAESDAETNLSVIGPILERRGFMRLFVPSISESRIELDEAIRNGEEYFGLVIEVEAKLAVLLEVSRTRSGATQILQSQFFEVVKGFALTPDILVQLQRITNAKTLLTTESTEAPLVIARLRQLDILLQTMSALVISLGRQNPAITKYVRSSLEWQEPTVFALFQAYCMGGEDTTGQTLAQAIWQVATLLDNLKDMVGEDKTVWLAFQLF